MWVFAFSGAPSVFAASAIWIRFSPRHFKNFSEKFFRTTYTACMRAGIVRHESQLLPCPRLAPSWMRRNHDDAIRSDNEADKGRERTHVRFRVHRVVDARQTSMLGLAVASDECEQFIGAF